jgi:SAM-dependent methyltransferase
MLQRLHARHVHQRRAQVLSAHIAELLPTNIATVLDVGCGDGRLSRLIQQKRPDLSLKGIDVLLRPRPEIPVTLFDGTSLPLPSQSADVVMFVDVLHHTTDPMQLLREAVRVARAAILIKDHVVKGLFARATLRFMDGVGNRRHHVALPHNYWRQEQWNHAWTQLRLNPAVWRFRLGLYPAPANLVFERSLHFLTLLHHVTQPTDHAAAGCLAGTSA